MSQALNLFDDMPEIPEPKRGSVVLSHYTDLAGLLSIIENGELWASNILFLNDRREMDYGLEAAKDVLKEVLQRVESEKIRSSAVTSLLSDIPDVYACCFCEEPDMLSQWRGYGGNKQNVSVQFSQVGLINLAIANGSFLTGVIYGKQKAMELIRNRLQRDEQNLPSGLERFRENINEDRRQAIYDTAPQIKDPSFQEEREWRIIAGGNAQRKVFYRPRDNVLMPFLKLRAMDGQILPIRRVTVGPGKESALTRKSVEHYLRQKNGYENIEVAVSEIPFRT